MSVAATLCVRESNGTWHAISSAGPDPQAFNDPIACGGVITLPSAAAGGPPPRRRRTSPSRGGQPQPTATQAEGRGVNWYRNQRGTVVHRDYCPYKGSALPWHWADGLDLEGLRRDLWNYAPWVRPCQHCIGGEIR